MSLSVGVSAGQGTGAEPRTYKQSLPRADRPEWAAAENRELAALIDLGCWEVVDAVSVPEGTRIYR